jgi:uridine kinase
VSAGGRQLAGLRCVIAVAGPVGGGKSTLVRELALRLADSTQIHFDRYEKITEQPIEKIKSWMESGAQIDEMIIEGLPENLLALKEGRTAVDPLTGAAIPPGKYILFETQFGRRHAATGRLIDFLVWIDTPLDIALARKLREFSGAFCDSQERDGNGEFARWLQAYLINYLDVVGELLRMQHDTVRPDADLTLDGTVEAAFLAIQVEREITRRFG